MAVRIRRTFAMCLLSVKPLMRFSFLSSTLEHVKRVFGVASPKMGRVVPNHRYSNGLVTRKQRACRAIFALDCAFLPDELGLRAFKIFARQGAEEAR